MTADDHEPINAGVLFNAHLETGGIALTDLSRPGAPRDITYKMLDDGCNAVARGLVAAGLGSGDRVAILSHNRLEFIEVMLGATRAGCVPVPLNTRLAAGMIHQIVRDADARIVFADAGNRDKCPDEVRVVNFDEEDRRDAYGAFVRPGPFAALNCPPDAVAIQPYTSGSTGRPKGVLLTHGGIRWVSTTVVRVRRMGPAIRTLVAAPMFHKNAMLAIKYSLVAGGRAVVLPRFEASAYLQAIVDYRCTLLTGVPTMFALLLRETSATAGADYGFVERIGFGSAPGSDALYDRLTETFPNASIENNYGLTEGGPVMFGPHPRGLPRPRNSVGYVMEGGEVRLANGPSPDEGVLHVRNPGVMLGYHDMPEATAARMLPDGWLDTGDVLRRDANGFYYFVGRTDDMFICSGENIYPSEVESMLEGHPDIQEAAVVPVADEIKGQAPHAFIVRRPGATLDEEAVKRHALAHGATYAYPRRIHFVSALPLSGANKIDRKALIEQARRANGND
ncbi:MAG: class I adenylate-forming enzyme family protein [Rhodospirillales bacterium]